MPGPITQASAVALLKNDKKQKTEPTPTSAPNPTPAPPTPAPPSGSSTPPASPAPANSPPPAQTTVNPSPEIAKMSPRLRDLIAKLSADREKVTDLQRFASRLAEREPMTSEAVEAADMEQLKEQIIDQASSALLAQATHSQDSVLALLRAAA